MKLIDLRQAFDMDHTEFAQWLGAGDNVTAGNLRSWESGKGFPNRDQMKAIRKKLPFTWDFLNEQAF